MDRFECYELCVQSPRHVAAFLRGERPALATVAEGRDVLRLTLACYRAAELGRRVMISEDGNNDL